MKNISLMREGRPLSPAASSVPNHGGGNVGRSAYSTPSGKEMAHTKKGAKVGAENSLRSSAERNISLRGGDPSAESDGVIGAKLWRR